MRDNEKGTQANMFFPPMPELDSIKYYKQTLQVSVHHFYVVDEIGDVGPFLDMVNVLKTAEQHDTIFIYLNTPGGNLYTAIQLISAIRQSQATVVTCIEGMVASAGTLLFLAGHKHVVNPNCTFMIHNYSHGMFGKGNETALQSRHSEYFFAKLAKDMYGRFLTPEEIEAVTNGKDLWMESEEVLKRLDAANSASSVGALMESLEAGPATAGADATEEQLAIVMAALAAGLEDEAEEAAESTKQPSKRRAKKSKA